MANTFKNRIPMPIGIPDPTIDFLDDIPAWPTSWETDNYTPGYYYVEADRSGATDTNNPYGNPSKPRATLPRPIPAGSVVVVRGTYNRDQGGSTWFESNGTDQEFALGQRGKVYIDGGVNSTNPAIFTFSLKIIGYYFLVDGLTTKPALNRSISIGSPSTGYPTYNGVVRNCQFIGAENFQENTAVSISCPHNVEEDSLHDVVFYNNTIMKYGPWSRDDDDNDSNGMGIQGNSKRVWVIYNTIRYTAGSAIQLGATKGTTTTLNHIYLGKNDISYCSQGGITGKYCKDIVISQNHIHHIYDRPWTPSKGIGMQYAPDSIWMLYNEIHDCRYAMRGAGTNSTGFEDTMWKMFSIGNLCYDIKRSDAPGVPFGVNDAWNNSSGVTSTGGYIWLVANNAFINIETGVTSPNQQDLYTIENNIFLNVSEKVIFGLSTNGFSNLSHNIIGANDVISHIGKKITSFSEFETEYGDGTNINDRITTFADKTPAEIIAEIRNSPLLKDGGVNLAQTHLDSYMTRFGVDLRRGLYDKITPQGASRDIGPWEDGNLFVEVLPVAPSGVFVDALREGISWVSNSLNETGFDVYKDDVLLGSVGAGITFLSHPEALTGYNEYYVYSTNLSGKSPSARVRSVPMEANLVNNISFSEGMGGALFCRADTLIKGRSIINNPVSPYAPLLGSPYGMLPVINTNTETEYPENGHVYIVGTADAVITGSVISETSDVVDIYITTHNFGTKPAVFDFQVKGSSTLITNTGGFSCYRVTVSYTGQLDYTFTTVNGSEKARMGIAAIVEAPMAQITTVVDDSFTTMEGDEKVFNVTRNDTAPFGDVAGVSLVSQASNGSVTIIDSHNVLYVPNPGFYGSDSYTYTNTDGNVGTVNITVTQYVANPVASDFTYTVRPDGFTVDFVNPDGITGEWDFGDGTTSTAVNPVHVYATNGDYTAQLENTNSQVITINVEEQVEGGGDGSGETVPDENAFTYVITDNSVQFDNNGNVGTWDFGDGTTSTEVNPVKVYTIGNYGISIDGGAIQYLNINFEPGITPEGGITERLIGAGDSITAAGDLTNSNFYRVANDQILARTWGPWTCSALAFSSNDYIVDDNIGVSGYRTDQFMVDSHMNVVLSSNATIVYLMIGINDITQGRVMADVYSNYTYIVNKILSTNKKVLIAPVAYTNVDVAGDVAINTKVDELNAFLLTLETEDNSVKVATANTEYNDLIVLDSNTVTRDGTHPNNRGGLLLGEKPAVILDNEHPSSIIKNSVVPSFENSGGTVSSNNGTMPDGWNSVWGKAYEPDTYGDGTEVLKVTLDGTVGETISNKMRVKLLTLPTGLAAGWYIAEVEVTVEDAEALQRFRLAIGSAGGYGPSEFATQVPMTNETFKSGVPYRFRTLKGHIAENDSLSLFYVEADQVAGTDVKMYISNPKLYRVS